MCSTAKSTLFNCQRPSSWTLWPLLSASPEGIVRLKHALTTSTSKLTGTSGTDVFQKLQNHKAEPQTGSFSSTLRVTRACFDDKQLSVTASSPSDPTKRHKHPKYKQILAPSPDMSEQFSRSRLPANQVFSPSTAVARQ